MPYDHISIEKKWQKFWEENRTFRTQTPPPHPNPLLKERESDTNSSSPRGEGARGGGKKKYILDMFPYPSGAGLHVGHPKGYTATDIVSRYYHAKGYNVLHPMGFDAFGLPAENYAIKTGTHPAVTTKANIETFLSQMKALGFSYDWDRMVDTTDPGYYQWTQWIFLKLFERGLAYEQNLPINYCPSCKTGLANEEVLADNSCDRCGTQVERRPIRQWVLKITEYADRLIEDLDELDWPEGIKEMQRNWIGKSEGCEFRMMKSMNLLSSGGGTSETSDGGLEKIATQKNQSSVSSSLSASKSQLPSTGSGQALSQGASRPTALILHGWDDKENRTEWHWMTPLKADLEKAGYDVIMEQLPGNNVPDLEKQLAFLDQYRDRLDERSVIIGHSMGGFLGMHFVERLEKKIDKLICIAPVFNGLIDHVDWSESTTGWDVGSASMRQNYNPEKIKEQVNDWQVFLSENDEGIHYDLAKKHFDSIGDVKITSIPSAGHFCEGDGYDTFPVLLEAIVPSIRVYTTRVDTVYGMTYAVLAPDHPSVEDFITDEQRASCDAYIEGVKGKSDLDRTNEGKEKTGVFTGSYVVNPFNGESVPLWIADYVLGSYGTGAVMAVPAHDERDWEFAKKYGLPIKMTIAEYNQLTGENAPREGFPTREKTCATLIVKHPTEEKYLVQDFENGELGFTGGGIEEGETPEQAAIRELEEESGLTDILKISLSSIMVGHGFKPRKEMNCKDPDYVFAVELGSLEGFRELCHENVVYINRWYTRDEIINNPKFKSHHKKQFQDHLKGGYSTTEDGILMSSAEFSGLSSPDARRVLTEKAEKEGFGHKKVNYKLRDWLFSRQRYWGEPIPLIHISKEDYDSLPRIDKMEDAKIGEAYVIATKEAIQSQDNDSSYTESPRSTRDDESGESLVIDGKIFSQIYDGLGGEKLVCDYRLPLLLPEVEKYEPAGDGQSPLATVPSFVNVKLAENLNGKRETNTMPQWGGSCWYYLRYMDPKNSAALAGKEVMEYWQNVDEYVGGAEHAVLHLLYARFWHKVLYDIGVVPTKEPFQKLTNVGMILAYAYEREDGGLVAVDLVEEVSYPLEKGGHGGLELPQNQSSVSPTASQLPSTSSGQALSQGASKTVFIEKSTGLPVKQVVAKMSKSLKNVVNPNDIVREYGADTLRLYEMSMSAFTDTAPWNPEAIIGVRRFLDRAYAAFTSSQSSPKGEGVSEIKSPLSEGEGTKGGGDDMKAMKLLHKTVKKVGEDIVGYKFNTAISALMILLGGGIPTDEEFALEWKEKFAIMLHPFAPHMAEELYQLRVNSGQLTVSETENTKQKTQNSIYDAPWPTYDDWMLVDDEVTIAVQVNGKLRGTLTCLNGVMQEEVSALAHEDPNIYKWIEGKTLVKEIYIPNKMLSIVVKE